MPRAVSEEQPRSGRELVGQIKDRSGKGHWVVGVCYSPPDQEEAVDETFLLQLQEVLCLQALVLMGDFSHPDTCWESGTAGGRQSRRFLESVKDNLLVQEIDGPTRGEALPDLVLTNAEESVREARLEAAWAVLTCLGGVCDLEECRPGKKWSRTLNFRRANFWLHGFLLCFTVTFLCAHH